MATYEDFQLLEIKAAEIMEAKEHPNADKLLLLKINTGGDVRQIVAGIKNSYSINELPGKKISVITNLDPAIIRGEESNGMLLAASSDDGPVLIVPEKDVLPGSKIK